MKEGCCGEVIAVFASFPNLNQESESSVVEGVIVATNDDCRHTVVDTPEPWYNYE